MTFYPFTFIFWRKMQNHKKPLPKLKKIYILSEQLATDLWSLTYWKRRLSRGILRGSHPQVSLHSS